MNFKYYRVILTNGNIKHTYDVKANNETEAVIKAQYSAIENCRGYEVVNCREIDFTEVWEELTNVSSM